VYKEAVLNRPDINKREFDVIIFGATGYTGNIICKYLSKTYGLNNNVKWAIAGRSMKRL
jgi:short subunit dehydrogenase-like uncharacterized protein